MNGLTGARWQIIGRIVVDGEVYEPAMLITFDSIENAKEAVKAIRPPIEWEPAP
jgi:hypothetical protein